MSWVMAASSSSKGARMGAIAHTDVDQEVAAGANGRKAQVEVQALCSRTDSPGIEVCSRIQRALQVPAHGMKPFSDGAPRDHGPFVDGGDRRCGLAQAFERRVRKVDRTGQQSLQALCVEQQHGINADRLSPATEGPYAFRVLNTEGL